MLKKLKQVLAGKAEDNEKPHDNTEEVTVQETVTQKSGFFKPKAERVQILGDYQNPMWKKGRANGGLGEGCKVWVPRRFSNRLRHKVIECQRVDENGETYYKYLP
jgi:hypothetical protein